MKKLFLDTNILLDYYLNRAGANEAEMIFKQADAGKIELFVSVLTFANLAYVIKRQHTKEEVYTALDEIERRINALPMDRQQLRNAINQPCKDFEDMLQYQCAVAGCCDVIITNNTKDYREFCKLPFMSSRDFLLNYFSNH